MPDCRYGRHRSQLCHLHHTDWTAAAAADNAAEWAAAVKRELDDQPGCQVPGCDLWASFSDGFCVSHQGRFNAFRRRSATDDKEAFLVAVALAGVPRLNLTGLTPLLKLEVQYVIQRFLADGPRRVNLSRWNAFVRAVHARDANSLLDRTVAEWTALLQLRKGNPDGALFISWGWDQVDYLVHGTGWDREYPLDTWTLNRVGHAATGVAHISFASVAQPWLRELVKQWTRHRLSIGIASPGVRTAVGVLGLFSAHLNSLRRPPHGFGDVTRSMVQTWCEDLALDHPGPRSRTRLVTVLSTFLRDVHRYGWAPGLPSTTVVFSEDFPRLHGTGPGRALPEAVVARIESEEALVRLTQPDHQLMTRILIRCGLRSGDCRQLMFDCLVHDGDGHPYLQYLNHQIKRTRVRARRRRPAADPDLRHPVE